MSWAEYLETVVHSEMTEEDILDAEAILLPIEARAELGDNYTVAGIPVVYDSDLHEMPETLH